MYKIIVRVRPAGGGKWLTAVWRKITIRKSLDEICHYMELELPVGERDKIHKHDKVEVRLYSRYITPSDNPDGTRRVTTVMVDEATLVSGSTRKSIMVIGRSPARDIVDSSWSDGYGGTLENVLRAIATDKFGIPVSLIPKTLVVSETIPSFSLGNESPWTKLLTSADNFGYIFTSNEAGGLYLWKVGSNQSGAGFFLEEGRNTQGIQVTENGAEQFHEYVVRGGGLPPAREIDDTCKNKRVLTIDLTDLKLDTAQLERRALTEKRRRKDIRIRATVSGWGLNDAQIQRLGPATEGKEIFWNPNFLIPVTVPSIAIDGNLLISEVEQTADESSMTSAVTVVNKEVYL